MTERATKRHKTPMDAAHVVPRAVSLIRHHAGSRQPAPRLSAAARTVLTSYSWPGGEAELDACIQRALILAREGMIEAADLGLAETEAGTVRCRARAAVLRSLRAAHGSRALAAARLGISPRSLRLLVAQLRTEGIPVPAASRPAAELSHD